MRGIDIPNIDTVIVVGDIASGHEYMHLAGRTARCSPGSGSKPGVCLSIIGLKTSWCLQTWAKQMDFVLDEQMLKPMPEVRQASGEEDDVDESEKLFDFFAEYSKHKFSRKPNVADLEALEDDEENDMEAFEKIETSFEEDMGFKDFEGNEFYGELPDNLIVQDNEAERKKRKNPRVRALEEQGEDNQGPVPVDELDELLMAFQYEEDVSALDDALKEEEEQEEMRTSSKARSGMQPQGELNKSAEEAEEEVDKVAKRSTSKNPSQSPSRMQPAGKIEGLEEKDADLKLEESTEALSDDDGSPGSQSGWQPKKRAPRDDESAQSARRGWEPSEWASGHDVGAGAQSKTRPRAPILAKGVDEDVDRQSRLELGPQAPRRQEEKTAAQRGFKPRQRRVS